MKKIVLSLALAAAMAPVAVRAQDPAPAPASPFIAAEAPVQYLAKDRLIGIKVKGPDGTIVGDIEDIILSGDHQVIGVIMGTGGYFGLFEKKVGVAIDAIQFEVTDAGIGATLPAATHDALASAPEFQRNSPKKTLFERAVEKTQEIRDKTGASAKDAYEKAKENAGPAIEKAKEQAKEAYEKAKEAAQEAVDKAKEAAKSVEPAPAPAAPEAAPAAPAEPAPKAP